MTPQEYSEKLFRALHYSSYSRMTTYFDCGRFFELQYVYDVKPEFEAPALAKGNILHEYYAGLNDPGSAPEAIKIILSEFPKKYPLEFMKYSQKWKSHAKSLPPGNLVLVEKEMRMDIPIPEPLVEPSTGKKYTSVVFKGFVDYMNMNRPGVVYMVDFKSGRASTAPKYADQLAIYALMVFATYSQVQTVYAYTYDISDNMSSEVAEQNSFEFTRERDYSTLLETLSKMIWSVIDSAMKGKFAPTPCIRCSYCPDYSCRYNKTPTSKRGITGKSEGPIAPKKEPEVIQEAKEAKPEPKPKAEKKPVAKPVTVEYDDTYGPPRLEEPEPEAPPETISLEPVTKIGDKEKKLLLDLKSKLEKAKGSNK